MKKIIEIPEVFIEEMKIEALKKGFRSFKAYLEDLIEKDALRIHEENEGSIF